MVFQTDIVLALFNDCSLVHCKYFYCESVIILSRNIIKLKKIKIDECITDMFNSLWVPNNESARISTPYSIFHLSVVFRGRCTGGVVGGAW